MRLAKRHGAWLPVVALHLLALLAAWSAAGPPAAKPGPRLLTVRLLAAPAPAPPKPSPLRRSAPALAALSPVLLMPAPALALLAEPGPPPASPPMLPLPPPAAPTAASAAVTAFAPPSLPPEHAACSARGVERHYPALLRERGIQGRVLLRVQVDELGRAAEVQVHSGSGWRLLDEAARRVALACPYLPARRGEQTMAAWVEYPVRFALN